MLPPLIALLLLGTNACTPRSFTLVPSDSVLGAVSTRGSSVALLIRHDDVNQLLHADFCSSAEPTELLRGDPGSLTRIPFVVSDSLLLVVEHSQQRGFLIDLSTGTAQERWFPSRFDPAAPVRQIVGGVLSGRLVWRVNALKDSIPPMPPFQMPWAVGESVVQPDPADADFKLRVSAEVLAASRGDYLWTISKEHWLTRTRVSGTQPSQSDSTAIPLPAVRAIATPDGALWLGASPKSGVSRWTAYLAATGTFAGCSLITDRVLTALSSSELLVERRNGKGPPTLAVIRPQQAPC